MWTLNFTNKSMSTLPYLTFNFTIQIYFFGE